MSEGVARLARLVTKNAAGPRWATPPGAAALRRPPGRLEVFARGLRRVTAAAACAGMMAFVLGAAFGASPSAGRAPSVARSAPKRPDFSGTWVLDTARSEFGRIPGGRPIARTDVIDHRDPVLRQTLFLSLPSGRDTTRYRYTTDSARVVHEVDQREIEAHAWWEGATLCLLSKAKIAMLEMTLGERWTLTPDGKTLIMRRRVKSPVGDGDQRLVFGKK